MHGRAFFEYLRSASGPRIPCAGMIEGIGGRQVECDAEYTKGARGWLLCPRCEKPFCRECAATFTPHDDDPSLRRVVCSECAHDIGLGGLPIETVEDAERGIGGR